jgi:hypothetical protein
MVTAKFLKYARHYIGHRVVYKRVNEAPVITDLNGYISGDFYLGAGELEIDADSEYSKSFEWAKLILTHSSDMGRSAHETYKSLCHRTKYGDCVITSDTPESLDYALRQGVDMFDLLSTGDACTEKQAESLIRKHKKECIPTQ